MDDLISRAAAITEVEQWAEHGYDVIHWTGIKAMLEVQPAVDAVPVEWLREKMRGYASALKSTETAALVKVMQMWKEEQEG